ncbi:MAG: hypothetical protein E7161_04355 [Firmicutes bacterium]|nr:hypothetical protein [Bacillota bacterium]
MYLKLDNKELEKLKRASDITSTDYELLGNLMPAKNMMSVIEDLLYEIDRLEEKYDDLKNDMESNYKAIPIAEQYGISEREFV